MKRKLFGIQALLVIVTQIAVVFLLALPAPKVQAAAGDPLCYNAQAGSLPIICPKGTAIPADEIINGKTHAQGAIFENNKCYTFARVEEGWKETSCEADVFKQAMRGTPPIPKADDPALTQCDGEKCDIVAKLLNPVIDFGAAALGIVAAISLAIGGQQYGSAGDDPAKIAKAKERITNSVLALLAFIFLWAFLQWLVPGGVF